VRAVEVEVAANADHCYRLLCDVRRVPEWVSGVADVAIVERDAQGRASLVRFTSMPGRGSLRYLLRYSYDDESRTLRWQTEVDEERGLAGAATVVGLGPARARLRYELSTSAASTLPIWARDSLLEDQPGSVAEAFVRWVEQTAMDGC
jgi:hypothetical protein